MFEDISLRKKANKEKLAAYGFSKNGNVMSYTADIMGGTFALKVTINETGAVDTSLTEKDGGEEYILYKTNAVGAYVGEVRAAVESVLTDISERCFEPSVFKAEQTQRVMDYVNEKYGDELEFLWEKFPDNAIFRRTDNRKWYGLILTIKKSKLGVVGDDAVEIAVLRCAPENMDTLLTQSGYFPGWHMNKKSWYTVILDGTLSDTELFGRIDESFALAGKAK